MQQADLVVTSHSQLIWWLQATQPADLVVTSHTASVDFVTGPLSSVVYGSHVC